MSGRALLKFWKTFTSLTVSGLFIFCYTFASAADKKVEAKPEPAKVVVKESPKEIIKEAAKEHVKPIIISVVQGPAKTVIKGESKKEEERDRKDKNNKNDRNDRKDKDDVVVCHKIHKQKNILKWKVNFRTISINKSTLKVHLAHGDILGVCPVGKPTYCGDRLVNNGEECDGVNIISCNMNGYAGVKDCLSSCVFSECRVMEFCGDSAIQLSAGEQCDDGSIADNDGCSAKCINEFCGDGIVNNGEQCDDRNNVFGDGCNESCRMEFCGDGIVSAGLNENCDSDYTSCVTVEGYQGMATCNMNCTAYDDCQTTLFCGDGICSSLAENTFNCYHDCPNLCGNGDLEYGEGCDDGNFLANDGCGESCEAEFCGDGIIQPALGEQCEGINGLGDLQGCDSHCRVYPITYCETVVYRDQCALGNNVSFAIEKLTFAAKAHENLSISPSGQYAIWTEQSKNTSNALFHDDVFLYDGTSVQLYVDIAQNTHVRSPVVNSKGQGAYVLTFNGQPTQTLYYFENKTKPVAIDSADFIGDIRINDCGQLVWQKKVSDNTEELFTYINKQKVRLTADPYADKKFSVNNLGHIGWAKEDANRASSDNVYFDNVVDQKVVFDDELNNGSVLLNNQDKMIWLNYSADAAEKIYRYDGNETSILIENADEMPDKLNFNNIGMAAWLGQPYGAGNANGKEAYFFDGKSIHRLTEDSLDDNNLTLADNGYVLWQHTQDDGTQALELFNGMETLIVPSPVTSNTDPIVSRKGSSLYWRGFDGTAYQVYKASLKCSP